MVNDRHIALQEHIVPLYSIMKEHYLFAALV